MNYIYYNEFGKEVKKYLSPIAKGSSGIKIYIFSDFDNSSETEYEVSASFKKADGFVAGDIFLPLSSNTKNNPYNQQAMYYRELTIGNDVTDIVGGLQLSIRYIQTNVIEVDPDAIPPVTYEEKVINVTGMVTFNIYDATSFISPPQNTALINLKNYVDDRDGNFVVKEAGKGLSEENYTLLEKNKLASVEQNAQKNVQSDFNQTDNTKDDFIKNTPVIPSIAGLEDSANKIDTFDGVVDNIKYPGALLVKNYLEMLELLKANAIPLLSLSPESPILPEVNDCFYQEDVKRIFKWNGTSWLPLVDPEDYLYQYNGKQYKYNASAGLVTVGKALSMGDYYTQEQIDAILSATYRPGGSKTGAELVSSLLIKANLGLVYDISTDFTSTIDFVEGAGKLHTAGTNVAVVEISAGVYKFDIMSGFVDLSGYVEKDGTKVLSDNNFTTLLKDKLTGAEVTSNKVIAWSETTNNTRYPSEKLVKDSLDELENTIQGVSDLSPFHYEGTFDGGEQFVNLFNNLIVGFEDLKDGLAFNETKLRGSYFVCGADLTFYFYTTYNWSAAAGGGITSAIVYTWAAPFDLDGIGSSGIDLSPGDIISILDFSYNAVSNTISTLIKVEKNLEENFVVKNESITPATKAKITYDAKGLVTAGADLIADDIPAHQHTKSEITDFPTIPDNKSYSKTIAVADWTTNEYAVTITNLTTSDTVLLSGADEIFTTNGLSATITANTLTFEVTTTPTESIVVNFTVIKTTGGSV